MKRMLIIIEATEWRMWISYQQTTDGKNWWTEAEVLNPLVPTIDEGVHEMMERKKSSIGMKRIVVISYKYNQLFITPTFIFLTEPAKNAGIIGGISISRVSTNGPLTSGRLFLILLK